jgi:hypothetical protein
VGLVKEVTRDMWAGHRSNDCFKTCVLAYECC